MSVITAKNRMSAFTSDSVVEDYDFDLLIHVNTEFQVWYRPTGGNYALLVLNTDYGVVFNEQGGTVSTNGYTAPLAAGTLLIIRHIDLTQQTNWLYNDSHTGGQHQNDFDRSTMRDLQQQEELDRCPKFVIHSDTKDITFPEPVANMILGWNAGGTDLTNMSPITIAVLIAEEIIAGSVPEELTDLSDITITAPASGDLLRHDGSLWLNDPYTNIDHDQLTNFAANEHFTEVSIDHVNIQNIGTNTHAQIDTHLALANEHIDWTSATQNLLTTGSGTFDELTITGNAGFSSSLIIFQSLEGDSTSFFRVVALDGTLVLNVDSTNERVGIKTGTPSYLLDVNGVSAGTSFITASDIGIAADPDLLQLAANALTVNGSLTVTSKISASTGTEAAPSHTFTGLEDTGMYAPDADSLGFTVNGSQVLEINPTETVIVGNLEPFDDDTSDLGHPGWRWRNLSLSGNANVAGTGTFAEIITPAINSNTAQDLKLWENLEIADAADGQSLYVYRNAATEATKYIRLFVDKNTFSWIDGESTLLFGVGGVFKFLLTPTDINVYEEMRFRNDNDAIKMGAGDDCSITYNGTNMVINPKVVGTGYLQVSGEILATEKVMFTQTDGLEYITGALNDGYMDYGATTGHRFNNNVVVTGRVGASTQGLPISQTGDSAGNIYWDDDTRILHIYSDNSGFGEHNVQTTPPPDEITATDGGVAASVETLNTEVTTNGDTDLDNVTLANGRFSGQIKHIYCVVEGNAGDTWKITPATMCGGTQITFSGVGEGCTLAYADNEGWVVVANNGGTIS